MSGKRYSSRSVICNDIEDVTPVKKGRNGESSVTATPDSVKSSYAAAMKELAESFSPIEEVFVLK